jgi:hypothetical protein
MTFYSGLPFSYPALHYRIRHSPIHADRSAFFFVSDALMHRKPTQQSGVQACADDHLQTSTPRPGCITKDETVSSLQLHSTSDSV